MVENRTIKQGFKRGFTLIEMMIVVAIIAILAGVAIPQYTKYVRKSEAVEAVGFLKQLVDAESAYKSSHGKFYIGNDMNKTIKVLAVDTLSGKFSYNMMVKDDTVLIRAYKNTASDGTAITTPTAPFIYMFYPEEKSANITPTYNADEWDNTVYTSDFIDGGTTDSGITIGGTWID